MRFICDKVTIVICNSINPMYVHLINIQYARVIGHLKHFSGVEWTTRLILF